MRALGLLVLLLVAAPAGAEEDLSLVLTGPSAQVRAGDTFVVYAELRGSSVARLRSSVKDVEPPPFEKDGPRFTLPLTLKAGKPGPLAVGPYELEAFGRKLRSNALRIEVKPALPVELRLSVDKTAVAPGSPFQLVATLSSLESAALRESPLFAVTNRSTNMAIKYVDGVATRLTRCTFTIEPAGPGTLRFDASSFDGLPEVAPVQAVTVEVR